MGARLKSSHVYRAVQVTRRAAMRGMWGNDKRLSGATLDEGGGLSMTLRVARNPHTDHSHQNMRLLNPLFAFISIKSGIFAAANKLSLACLHFYTTFLIQTKHK